MPGGFISRHGRRRADARRRHRLVVAPRRPVVATTSSAPRSSPPTAGSLHASETENPDLFWAIRGGGGNFGVVTEFEFALHPVGPMVHLGLFLFSPEQGGELFRFAREFVRDLPDECGVFLAGLSAPPAPFVPEELHFTPAFALAVVGFGDDATPRAADRADQGGAHSRSSRW